LKIMQEFSLSLATGTAVYNERLAIILGFITLLSVVLTAITCRSFISLLSGFGIKRPLDSTLFSKIYNLHPYFWWGLWIVLLLHILVAIFHLEIPTPDDVDAFIHWVILALALLSLIFLVLLLLSCRIIPLFWKFISRNNLLTSNIYKSFYRLHSYLWWPFLASVVGHVITSFIHTGVWPR
jgi:hypothetical protein